MDPGLLGANMKINLSAAKLRAHQRLLFKIIMACLVGASLVLIFLTQDSTPLSEPEKDKPVVELTRTPEDKTFWLFKADKALREQSKVQSALQDEITELKARQEKILEQLEVQAQHAELSLPQSQESQEAPKSMTEFALSNPQAVEAYSPAAPVSLIFSERLESEAPSISLPHIDHFIPAGTYVKAVLLNGLDISAGISSQANPQPVLLRLVDVASLPNHAKSRLKDCRVIAAAHGELSNERVNMRLETLSCVQEDGHVIESQVTGFVNGLDGKNGVRGKVVLRDAEVLKRGFMGGLLSGLGKVSLGSKQGPASFGGLDAKGNLNLFKQSGTEGVGDAFELMAKYNIQRAEQYQPVLQVSAGVEVDVVFHAGTAFGAQKAGELQTGFQSLAVGETSP